MSVLPAQRLLASVLILAALTGSLAYAAATDGKAENLLYKVADLCAKNDFEQALQSVDQIFALKPPPSDFFLGQAWWWKGHACKSLQQDEEATEAFEESLELLQKGKEQAQQDKLSGRYHNGILYLGLAYRNLAQLAGQDEQRYQYALQGRDELKSMPPTAPQASAARTPLAQLEAMVRQHEDKQKVISELAALMQQEKYSEVIGKVTQDPVLSLRPEALYYRGLACRGLADKEQDPEKKLGALKRAQEDLKAAQDGNLTPDLRMTIPPLLEELPAMIKQLEEEVKGGGRGQKLIEARAALAARKFNEVLTIAAPVLAAAPEDQEFGLLTAQAHQGLGLEPFDAAHCRDALSGFIALQNSGNEIVKAEARRAVADLPQMLLDRATGDLQGGRPDHALQKLHLLVETNLPDALRPVLLRGQSYLALKQYEPAETDFTAALNAAPNPVEALEGRAEARMGRCEVEQNPAHLTGAAADLTTLADENAGKAALAARLAGLFERHNAPEQAARWWAEAAKLDPSFSAAAIARLLEAGQYPPALELLDRVLQSQPGDPVARLQMARALVKTVELKGTAAWDRRADETLRSLAGRQQGDGLLWRGLLAFHFGEYPQAVADLSEYLKFSPDRDGAKNTLDKARVALPPDGPTPADLANAANAVQAGYSDWYAGKSLNVTALQQATTVLSAAGKHDTPQFKLAAARGLALLKDPQARIRLDVLLASSPPADVRHEALAEKGMLLVVQQDWQQGADLLKTAVDGRPQEMVRQLALAHLCRAYAKLNRHPEASAIRLTLAGNTSPVVRELLGTDTPPPGNFGEIVESNWLELHKYGGKPVNTDQLRAAVQAVSPSYANGSPEQRLLLAQALVLLGERGEAKQHLDHIIKTWEGRVAREAQAERGMLLCGMGDYPAANSDLDMPYNLGMRPERKNYMYACLYFAKCNLVAQKRMRMDEAQGVRREIIRTGRDPLADELVRKGDQLIRVAG